MSKPVKEMMMAQIKERLDGARDYVVVDASKMDAVSNNELRIALRKEGVQMMAIKNALARTVFKAEGVEATKEVFSGPCAVLWGGSDIVSLAKLTTKQAKSDDNFVIRGGAIDGKELDPAGVATWSKAKGRDEVIADVVGAIVGPGSRLCGALKGPAGVLAGQIKTKSEEDGGE